MLRVISYGGGVFSCSNCRLSDIINYFNTYKKLPDYVDTSTSWGCYKTDPRQDLTNVFFKDITSTIEYDHPITISSTDWEPQFSDYRQLKFKELKPFISKYFSLSDEVMKKQEYLENKYNLKYDNLCAVRYRGTDKCKETNPPSYQEMIKKAKYILSTDPEIQFLVQTDEKEFLDAFLSEFPNTIYFNETPTMNHNPNTCLVFTMERTRLLISTLYFIASIKIISKCKYIITTSGNCEMWSILFRGNANNVYQYLNPKDVIYGVVNKTFDPNKTNFWIE